MKYRTVTGGRLALTSLATAALIAFGPSAWALGLGRLNVQSSLGEVLRAEIEVTSLSADEAASLNVRVASSDAYLAAGVDYSALLTGTRAVLSRRADGRPFIRVTSDRAVLEPFVDVILELTWASGRLVREYTLLLDPPREVASTGVATAPLMSSAPVPAAPQTAGAPATAAVPAARAPRPAAPMGAERAAAPAAPAARPSAASDYTVKPGDNLSRIAGRILPGGVALEQMLVALFRNNAEAFVGENMNRLKSGAVLKVPAAEAARQLSLGEAREFIQAQSADFGAYRQKLASGVPAATEAAARQATGKVEAAVEDRKQPATPAPDKLKLTQGAAKAASSAEAAIAKAAAAKQAASREAELARNVEELRKLQSASAKQATPQATPQAAASALALPPVPVASPLPAMAAAASAPVPASAVQAPASAPTPTPAKPAAKEESGLLDDLLDNPMLLPGAGVLLLLLGGAAAMRMRRRMSKAGETSFLESRVQPDSFFGASGGQRVDTNEAGRSSGLSSNPSSMSYSLSQLDAIGDVDPVAEADVYLAYGRDLQAEEILKEAMRSNPDRAAIRLKLLEVYAKRRDTKGFEALAVQFFKWQGATPEEWAKVQELGRSVDPENPLYAPGAEPDSGLPDDDGFIEPLSGTTQGLSSLPASPRLGLSRAPDLDGPTLATPARVGRDEPTPDHARGPDEDTDLDIDLDTPSAQPPSAAVAPESTRPIPLNALAPAAIPAVPGGFGGDHPIPAQADDAEHAELAFGDVDLERPAAAAPSADGMEFDLGTDTSEPESAAEPRPLEFDLGNLSLDVDMPAAGAGLGAASRSGTDSSFVDFDLAEAPASTFNEGASALEKKLDLADEFRQIGDVEGARDLLAEVIAEAEEGALKLKAQQMLDDLA